MRRSWPLRLLQVSPLIVMAMAALVWLGVPAEVRQASLQRATLRMTPEMAAAGWFASDPTAETLRQLDYAQQSAKGGSASEGLPQSDRLTGVGNRIAAEVMASPDRLYGESGSLEPLAIPADDPAFEPARAYERDHDARVSVFVLPARRAPPVAIAAVANASVMRADELRELEASGTLNALRRRQRGQSADELPVDVEGIGTGSGSNNEERVVYYSPRLIGGQVYELYGVYDAASETSGDLPETIDWTEVATPKNRTTVDRYAERMDGAVFVVGPTNAAPVPLRAADGMQADEAARLAELVFSDKRYNGMDNSPRHTTLEERQAGAGEWLLAAVSAPPPPSEPSTDSGAAPRQALALIAVYDTHPDIPMLWSRVGRTPVRQAQVWLGANFAVVWGALAVLFVASLIVSPLALRYERDRTEQVELERQREQIQREAQHRVVDRLKALSERMDTVSSTAGARTRREVEDVAADIESTVSELRGILGELEDRGREQHEQ